MALNESMIGLPIYAEDGSELGKVKEIRGRYFKVDAPMQFDYWLREDAVRSGTSGEVRLAVPHDHLDDYKVDESETYETGSDSRAIGRETTPTAGMTSGTMDTTSTMRDEPRVGREEHERLQLREEQLQARKETVQTGEVTIGKDIVTERQELDVPVTREEVVIERHPVEGRPAHGDISEREEIRVPVHEEQVRVEKEPVVYEEVGIGKRTVQETEHVTDEVRREEPRIEREGEVPVQGSGAAGMRGWEQVSPQYRQRWQTRYGTSGGRFEDYEPGYRYGHEMASDPRYQGRDWSQIEPELRQGYGSWAQRYGYQHDENSWERFKDQARESWDEGRRERRAA